MKYFKYSLIALCTLLLVGCTQGKNKETIQIVLDWVPNTNHTGLYVAMEKGYFGDLNVEVVQPPEGSTTSLIGSGGAAFGISFQDTMAPALIGDNPLPVTAVAALVQHNTSGILSLKETGIKSPKDLEGHNYATWDSPIELAIMKHVVTQDGGNFDNVTLIPNTVTDATAGLSTNLDSIWVFYAWDGIAAELNGLDTQYIPFKDYGEALDYYSPVLVANNTYLSENTEEAKKVIDGVKKGYEYAIENPQESADILLIYSPELDKDLVYKSQEWISKEYQADAKSWGVIDSTRWSAFYSWLNDNNLLESPIDPNSGFSNDYLKP